MNCYLFPEPTYFFFSSQVPSLLYYAEVPAIIIPIFIGFYVLRNGRHLLLNRLFFTISFLFSLWTISTLIEWTNIHSNLIMFIWSFSGVILGMMSIFCIYFIYVFLEKKDISNKIKVIFLALLAPVFFLMPTSLNISGFNITSCDAFEFEWIPYKIYYTFLSVIAMVWILVLLIRKYRISPQEFKKQIALMGVGIELFLISFFSMEFLASYLTQIGVLSDSSMELYGLFGIVVFMVYISILMVRFKTFNVKLFSAQALVWGIAILIGSQLFFTKIVINFILILITLVVSVVLGYFLIKSVKKEIQQKEELANLNMDLQSLLKQRESLMHLITHKVKGSFTRTKVLFASMADGTFGEVSSEIKRRAEQGLDFDNEGINTVDSILNVANMQNGNIKFDMKLTDFKGLVEKVISEKKIPAKAKGLNIKIDIKDSDFNVLGDAVWLKEVVNNLVENSIRYTKEGEISASLEKIGNKILFSVKDTGIGITEEDKKNLFTEGGRGRDSVKTNVDSTGYGLYTIKLVVDGHHGRVWAESEGSGKGSQFYVELPAIS